MKKPYIACFVLALLFSLGAFQVDAQERGEMRATEEPVVTEARPIRAELGLELRDRLEVQRAEMEARREAIQAEAEARRMEAQRVLEQRRLEVEARRQEATQLEVERRGEGLERASQARQTALERQVQNAFRIIDATINRLERIGERIESRIEKLALEGGSVAEAREYLALARANLENARTDLSTIDAIDLSGETSQDNFQRVRSAVAAARGHIVSAHQNLSLATRSLAGVQAEIVRPADSEEN